MTALKCKICGKDLHIEEKQSVCECGRCGTRQTIPDLGSEWKINLFNEANRLRNEGEFDKAYTIFDLLKGVYYNEAEAYWGLCLCEYGIKYTYDPTTGKKTATCHRASYESIFDYFFYSFVLKYAPPLWNPLRTSIYEEEAKEIDKLRKEIVNTAQNVEPFDIFICYKETDENGDRTVDSVIAQDIYNSLTGRGYKVFFSRITLEDKSRQEYESYIFSALNSAKVMLAIGTKYEYYDAAWVKNEWKRFRIIANKHFYEGRRLIPCYTVKNCDMPKGLRNLRGLNMNKSTFLQDMIREIEMIIPLTSFIQKGYRFLENKDFKSAEECFEKFLVLDPANNAKAYIGKMLCEYRKSTVSELLDLDISLIDNENFAIALWYANETYKSELEFLISIKAKIDNRKKEKERIKSENDKRKISLILNYLKNRKWSNDYRCIKTVISFFDIFPDLLDAEEYKKQALSALADLKEQTAKRIEALEEKIFKINIELSKTDAISNSLQNIEKEMAKIKKESSGLNENLSRQSFFDDKKQNEIKEKLTELDKEKEQLEEKLISLFEKEDIRNNYISKMESERNNLNLLDANSDINPGNILDELLYKLEFLEATVGSCIKFGSYVQTEDHKSEPIEWIVLDKEDDRMLIISRYALDHQDFHSSIDQVTWETCSLREWLNETFYDDAFSELEKRFILTSTVTADKNPNYSTSQGSNTQDKIFLLSISEANKYFSSDPDRECKATDYAFSLGLYRYSDRCSWWLRTSGRSPGRAAYVFSTGHVYSDGIWVYDYGDDDTADDTNCAVRPALWINLQY